MRGRAGGRRCVTPGGFIWLASYPKSGNTWMWLTLQSLLSDGAPVDFSVRKRFAPLAGSVNEMEIELDVEVSELTPAELDELLPDSLTLAAAAEPTPQFRKVHDCWGRTRSGRLRFPPAATRAAVHLARDPRDVAVSWAHHSGRSIEQSIAFMADSAAVLARSKPGIPAPALPQPLLSWSGHAESWFAADPAPLTIRYEEMLADMRGMVEKVAAHCGFSPSAAALDRAVAATRFDRLQAQEAAHGFDLGQADGRTFFRQGRAGSWRETLTPEQAARLENDHGAVMARLGYL